MLTQRSLNAGSAGSRPSASAPRCAAPRQHLQQRVATTASSSLVLAGAPVEQGSSRSSSSSGLLLAGPCNGSMQRASMMRHGNKVNRLGRPADQRKALIRGLVTELIRHGQIRTTKVKAKTIRPFAEHMITLAKDGSLHARRQALAFIYDKTLVQLLFAGAKERYGERNGGYTRVKREPMLRRGDASEMAVIELV